MLRTFVFADFLTLGNGVCGAASVLAAMHFLITSESGWLWLAMGLLPVALVLDFADGRVARWRRHSSPLGADLDSLADVISFGMAPAAVGYAFGLRGGWDVVILLYFVCCGISRLARFNATADALTDDVTGKVKYFEGTPIPTSVFIVLLLALLLYLNRMGLNVWLGAWDLGMILHPLALIYAISGSLMISTIRVPKI